MCALPRFEQMESYLRPGGPKVVTIEPTDWCNFSCLICVNRLIPARRKGFMSPKVFHFIADHLPPGTRRVNLFMGGEPLLHPRIGEFIRSLRGGPWLIKVNTNGSLLSSRSGEELLRNPPDILVISFDGESQETYEVLRGRGAYHNTRAAIIDFLRESRSTHFPSRVVVQVIKQYDSQIGGPQPAAPGFVREMLMAGADEVVVELLHDMNGRLRLPRFSYPPIPAGQRPCPKLVEELVIRWNGEVVACCCDHGSQAVVGSVCESDILTCWHSSRFVEFRRAHLELRGHDLALCRTCSLCRGEVPNAKSRRRGSRPSPAVSEEA